jgi:redox-sensitive bicupin YhaK (pirin superfamily)
VVSYVVDGLLTHRDSAGNIGTVPAGAFQRITAGTGIEHDESNRTDRPLRMFQIWFTPDQLDVQPSYATIETAGRVPSGTFLPVIGSGLARSG